MNNALDFVREFKMADHGISGWDIAIVFAAILVIWIVLPRLIVLAKISTRERARKVVNFVVLFFFSVFWLLIILNAILNENYTKLVGPVILLIMQKNLVDRFYAFYDKTADKLIDKTL